MSSNDRWGGNECCEIPLDSLQRSILVLITIHYHQKYLLPDSLWIKENEQVFDFAGGMSSTEAPPPPPVASANTLSLQSSEGDVPAPPPPLPSASDSWKHDTDYPEAGRETPNQSVAGLKTPDSFMSVKLGDDAPPPPAMLDETPLIVESEENNHEEEVRAAVRKGTLGLLADMKDVAILKEGWLKKKAGPLGITRKRYCVLYQNGILRYYSEDDQRKEHRKGKGDVSFQTLKGTNHDGKKFTVENENKVWHFEADDFIEAADWLAKFEIPGRTQTQHAPRFCSMSNSATLEAYGDSERDLARSLHTL